MNKARWQRIALWLVGGTMAYNVIEAGVALWSGGVAESVALVGFGFDSVIESVAAAALLWRLSVEARGAGTQQVEEAERRVIRFVGVTFIVLAAYVVFRAGLGLWMRHTPSESTVGIILAGASLVVMPLIALGKFRAARQLGSASLRAEAKETLACSYLSFALLLGLVTTAVFGWWWADQSAALLMVPWLIKEGVESIRGEDDDDDD